MSTITRASTGMAMNIRMAMPTSAPTVTATAPSAGR